MPRNSTLDIPPRLVRHPRQLVEGIVRRVFKVRFMTDDPKYAEVADTATKVFLCHIANEIMEELVENSENVTTPTTTTTEGTETHGN